MVHRNQRFDSQFSNLITCFILFNLKASIFVHFDINQWNNLFDRKEVIAENTYNLSLKRYFVSADEYN